MLGGYLTKKIKVHKKMKIKDIDIPEDVVKLDKKLTACFLQLKSPFFDEIAQIDGIEYSKFGWLHNPNKQRQKKIKRLLSHIRRFERHLDILIFPEYAIHEKSLGDLKKFSKQNKTIVIANQYDDSPRYSMTSIIFPNGKVYSQPKIDPSNHDTNFLSEVLEKDRKNFRFYFSMDTKLGKEKIYFQVFTCVDFLNYWTTHVDKEHGGVIIVPMCTPVIDDFVAYADSLLREKEPDERLLKSIITILCNATDVTSQSKGKKICGNSQVIGPYKGDSPKIEMGLEGGIIVDIDCLNAIQQPTPTKKRNTVIESPVFFSISKDGSIIEPPGRLPYPPTKWVVHPQVLTEYLKLHKYYGFFEIKDYYKHRNTLKRLSIGCDGIYGFQDVLIHSFEEDQEFSELRFRVSIGADLSTIGLKDPEYIEITNIIKYRGESFMHVKEDGGLEWNNKIDIKGDYIEEHKKEILELLHGREIDKKHRNDFKNKGIIIETLGVSDVSEEDRKNGFEEFLVFVFLTDSPIGVDLIEVFNNTIIKKFIDDDRIRTIEYCQSGSIGNLARAHYILHVVGNLKSLKEIIIDTIHRELSKQDVKCRTRVIPPAEPLSTNEYPSLLETNTDAWMRPKIKKMIAYNIAETDPFLIKKLTKNELNQICSIYENIIKLGSHRESVGIDGKVITAMKRNLYRFIYGVAHEILDERDITKNDRQKLDSYCGGLITNLSRDIEGHLQELLVKKGEELYGAENGVKESEKKLQSLWDTKYKNRPHKVKIKGQTSLGAMMQYIVLWNTHGDKNNEIRDANFTNKLKELQGRKVVEFRNDFSHGRKRGEQLLPNLKNRADIKILLSATEAMSDFAIEEKL